jgi:hypothetical protein
VARAPRLYRHKRVRKCAHVLGLQLCYGRGFIGARRPRDFCATLTRRRPRARARRKRAFQIGEIKRDGATCRNRLAHASPSPFIALMKRDRSRPGRAPVAPRSRPGHTRLCATRRETMKSSQTSRGCIMRGLRDEQSRLYCPRGLEFSFFLSFFLSFFPFFFLYVFFTFSSFASPECRCAIFAYNLDTRRCRSMGVLSKFPLCALPPLV